MEPPHDTPPQGPAREPCRPPASATGRSAIDVALEAAGTAGSLLAERFGAVARVEVKGRGNVVTDVDVAAERAVRGVLASEYPAMPVLGEETGQDRPSGDGWMWIVDPIDGTRNFASGVPHFSTVVALARGGRVWLGVTHDPMRGETFHAERGRGAFLNGAPVRVAPGHSLADGILGMDLSYDDGGAADQLSLALDLWPGMQTVRILGSAALGLAYVAAGRFHVFFHHRLEPWDQAAGLLLVAEAGGVVTDRSGDPAGLLSDGTVAAGPALHAEFMRSIAGSAWTRRTAT